MPHLPRGRAPAMAAQARSLGRGLLQGPIHLSAKSAGLWIRNYLYIRFGTSHLESSWQGPSAYGSWANSETSTTPQEIQPRLERCFLWLGHACNPGNPGNRGNAMVAPTHAPFHWVMCNPGKAMAVPSLERSRGSLHGSARLPQNAALVSLP